MRMYTQEHKFTCGIDLHARSLYVCVLDRQKQVVLHQNIAPIKEDVLDTLKPFCEDIVVGVESTFNWYWLADFCQDHGFDFVLGHALYMRAVHGTKVKNDKVDSRRIAGLLQSGMFPLAYVYPRAMRTTRDLLRRRTGFMRKKAELLGHIQLVRMQYNLPEFGVAVERQMHREQITEAFEFDDGVATSIDANLQTIDHYHDLLLKLEREIQAHTAEHFPRQNYLLRTIPGVGPILALNIIYEVGDINRFDRVKDFASYCRVINPKKTSAGKVVAASRGKIGNAHLKWTFNQAACGFSRYTDWGKAVTDRLKRKYNKAGALGVLSHKLARAAYFMLKRDTPFDRNRFERL